jgi:hypothetical protein
MDVMDWDAESGEYLRSQRYVGKGPGGVVADVELPSTVEGAVVLPSPVMVMRSGECVEVGCACGRTGAKKSNAKSDRHLVRKE